MYLALGFNETSEAIYKRNVSAHRCLEALLEQMDSVGSRWENCAIHPSHSTSRELRWYGDPPAFPPTKAPNSHVQDRSPRPLG